MNILMKMYLCMKLSVGHRILFLYMVPSVIVLKFVDIFHINCAVLIFFIISTIASMYAMFNFERLMMEDIIRLKGRLFE